MRAALVLLAALLLLPTVAAQGGTFAGHVLTCTRECRPSDVNDDDVNNTPVNVVLYAHITDALQRAPINAMPPDPGRERDINSGFLTPTVKVREDLVYFDNNWFFFYHLPTFVEYGPATSNQDGPLSYPLELSGKTAKLYWYLSPHAVPPVPQGGNSTSSPVGGVGAMPQVTVYARIETGRHPMHGTLIAEGKTSAPLLINFPGGDFAYEFEVPLDIKVPTIPPEEGFVVSINWHQIEDGEKQFSQSDWRIRSGIRFAPRVILPVANPMMLAETGSVFRSGVHYLVTDISPVFGAYDINPYSLNMTFKKGPKDTGSPTPVIYYYNPLKPQSVRVAWAVPNDRGALQAGTYVFQLSLMNLQSTYQFTTEVELNILEFRSSNARAPDIGVLGFAIALGLVIVLRRRA